MKFFNHLLLAVTLLVTACGSSTSQNSDVVPPTVINAEKHINKPYVVMISIDGYRHDYTSMYRPKHLSKLINGGSHSKGLIPTFPSKTFPNHYTLVTGLKAENHGIVANRFYDKKRKKQYRLGRKSTTQDGSWYNGEPIWVAAGKQGMVSASYFWVGSDANIQGRYPSYYYEYDGSVPNEVRINQVIKWLKMPLEKRPHYITLYFSDVDSAGHRFGPKSEEVKKAVHKVDENLGALFNGVKELGLDVNYIIVSDHGMHKIEPHKSLYLSDYIKVSGDIKIEGRGPHSNLYINDPKHLEDVYQKLKKADHITVYKKEEIPDSYGYKNSPRIGDLVLSMEPGYYLYTTHGIGSIPLNRASGGTHGYDTKDTEHMNGIFYAKGPNINKIGRFKAFDNIHVYPFVMNLLGLEIKTEIDGDPQVLGHLLKK